MSARSLLKHALPGPLRRWISGLVAPPELLARLSYAQEGEDMILARFFGPRRNGFYVDIGAHHPRRYSNTCYFHQRGWRGINIDACPGAMALFQQERPHDVNLEVAVSTQRGEARYYHFDLPELNGFDPQPRLPEPLRGQHPVLRTSVVPTIPLADILAEHLPAGQVIDFLSVDVEGHDLAALQSNDWTRYRPRFVVIEVHAANLADALAAPEVAFLTAQRYEPVARTYNSLIAREASIRLDA